MDILQDRIRLEADALLVRESADKDWDVFYLNSRDRNQLIWVLNSGSDVSFTAESNQYGLFIGPYIMGDETGYIVQLIELGSRRVTSVRFPFTDSINMMVVKRAILDTLG